MNINLKEVINKTQNSIQYKDLHWKGSFDDYLALVKEHPEVTRTAYQRIFDMILSHGTTEYVDFKKQITHYKFFDDEANSGKDAIYGLDVQLMKLVNVFKAAAEGYGTEKR